MRVTIHEADSERDAASGIFGLNNQPVNFSTLGNTSMPSFITTLKEKNKIPSLSWSYTAGAKYRKRSDDSNLNPSLTTM